MRTAALIGLVVAALVSGAALAAQRELLPATGTLCETDSIVSGANTERWDCAAGARPCHRRLRRTA